MPSIHPRKVERWRAFMLLEHGAIAVEALPALLKQYQAEAKKFGQSATPRLYAGCGPHGLTAKFRMWDLCDLRVLTPRQALWDMRLGFPKRVNGYYSHIKSMNSLGMLTPHEVRWFFYDVNAALEFDGVFELGFRCLDNMLRRLNTGHMTVDDLATAMGGRSQCKYYGAQRKFSWPAQRVRDIAMETGFIVEREADCKANIRMRLRKVDPPCAPQMPHTLLRAGVFTNIGGADFSHAKQKEALDASAPDRG